MTDEQINEVMRLADEIADYAWKEGLSDGAYSNAKQDRECRAESRAELEAYLRTFESRPKPDAEGAGPAQERRCIMTQHDTHQTPYPTCPHCGHRINADEMNYGPDVSEDCLWALAPNEGRAAVTCPSCDAEYWVEGGYVPHYTSAFSEEEL